MDHGLPTLADVLALPCLQAGRPEILTGEDELDLPVRWVHVSELTDIAAHLRGGELVLTTGIALPSEPQGLERYVRDLHRTGICGLVVELGRKFTSLPPSLITAADRYRLPLISLAHEIAFVEVTESVHTMIVDARVRQLERISTVQGRFGSLALEGASVKSILEVASELTGASMVLENLAHRVLAFSATGRSEESLLHGWERRSRAFRSEGSLSAGEVDDWVSAPVGSQGSMWGRLIAVCDATSPADERFVVQQAAATLALTCVTERDQLAAWTQAHTHLLRRLHEHSFTSATAIDAEASALGVPLEGRTLIGVAVIYQADTEDSARDDRTDSAHVERIHRIISDLHLAALIQPLDGEGALLLVSLPAGPSAGDAIEQLAAKVHGSVTHERFNVLIGVGSPVSEARDARLTLTEAIDVTVAAGAMQPGKLYYELHDIHVRGLLHLLRDDSRLQSFVERELGPLLEHDYGAETEYLNTLEVYLQSGCNKSVAASRLRVSRPTLYSRIASISAALDADLEDVETCLSLHVAVLALRSIRASRSTDSMRTVSQMSRLTSGGSELAS